jgi:hypothetical protein
MCDRCGNIFSEREDGWTSMQGTTMRRDEKGQMRQTTEALDACPRCSAGPTVPKPQLAEWNSNEAPAPPA